MKVKVSIAASLAIGLFSLNASAQKAKVVTAYNYNKSYEQSDKDEKDCEDLAKGVEAIQSAVKDDKTKDWAKTWYYGGNLYFNAALSEDEACKEMIKEPLDNTLDFYLTALKYNIEAEGSNDLDFEKPADQMKFMGYLTNKDTKFDDPTYTQDILMRKFPYIANAFINNGVEYFNAGNYEKALDYYGKSVMVNGITGRVDTLGMYNAALAAERLEKYDEALTYYSILSQIKYGGADIYLYMASIHQKKEDTASYIETIRKGLEVYPNNTNLILQELSYLMETGQEEEALASFDKAIANEPENSALYYNRGFIYDQTKKIDEAASDYSKALELKPDFFDAAYNLGAMYYNAGVEWNNKATSYDIEETDKYDEATKKANEYFMKAKPALEKAHELDETDQNTMASLVKIYAILGENDKYNSMKTKLQGK